MPLGFRGEPASPVLLAQGVRGAVGSESDGQGRRGGELVENGPRGAPCWADLAAWPSAAGLKARAPCAPSGPGRILAQAA